MNINDFKGGWFIGNFEPSIFHTKRFEVGYKKHKKGEHIEPHYHECSTEWTLIIKGKEKINDKIYSEGDIIEIKPDEIVHVEILEDLEVLVVRNKSIPEDKVLVK